MVCFGCSFVSRAGVSRYYRPAPNLGGRWRNATGFIPHHGSRWHATRCAAEPERSGEVKYNKEFGYSRKDVLLIGGGLFAIGFALYYGMQFAGVDPLMAGNFTQLIIFLGLCFGWVGSYVFRVANKKMTYVTQLEEYEEAVMKKRLEEMTEEEVERLMTEAESEKQRRPRPPQPR